MLRRKNIILNLLCIFLSVIILFASLESFIVNAYNASEISINLVKSNAVDVMLVSRSTDFTAGQIQNIESRIKSELAGYDVQFAGLETTEQVTSTNSTDPQAVFNNWSRLGATGQWSVTSYNGYNVIYNAENSNGVTGFYAPDTGDISDMTLEYDFMSADSDDDFVGVVLRLNVNDNKYGTPKPLDTKVSGYWYWESHKNNTNTNAKYMNGLYRLNGSLLPHFGTSYYTHVLGGVLTYYYDSNKTPFDYSDSWVNSNGVTPLDTSPTYSWTKKNQWIHYKYQMKGNTFSVWRDGSLVLTYTDTDADAITSGTFALINMSQASRYRNFVSSVTRVKTKSMTEILRNATWRDEATHVVIDIDKMLDSTLTESGELTSRLVADDVYLQFCGTDTNQASFTNYGQGFGKDENNIDKYNFINQSSGYDACITSTANYIKKILLAYNNSQYGIVNEITDIAVTPSGAKNNTADSTYPYGKWKIIHDNTKIVSDDLQNGMGVSNQSGMSMNNLTCTFDKPGNYTIYYMDVPIKTVYIHRRPVADFIVNWNSSTNLVSISDTSFDLDTNLGVKGNGIKSISWKYKKATDSNWIDGYPSRWQPSDGIIIIQMTVTDYQGCSSSIAKYLGDTKPVAAFSFNLNPVSLYEDISILNSSYDTTGNNIVSSNWVIKNSAGVQVASSNVNSIGKSFSFGVPANLNMPVGKYTVYLTVTNSAGVSSDTVSRTLYVSKVTSHAIYEYNWDDGYHDVYPEYADVFYKATYPTLVQPKKYYRIKFDKNTGTQVDYDFKDAYSVFDGWFLDKNFGSKIISGQTTVESNGNHSIYAKWTNSSNVLFPNASKVYKVSFNANDTQLDRAVLNTDSLTETWTFKGWYSDTSCADNLLIGKNGFSLNNISANQTLYAGWTDVPVTLPNITRTYTVTYDSNGGKAKDRDIKNVKFNGWFTEPSGGTNVGGINSKYTVNKNHTLYAQWGSALFKLPTATRDDSMFIGWFTKPQENGSYINTSNAKYIGKADLKVDIYNSQTLYAWYNNLPKFEDVLDGDFYEGQTVTGKDLLNLVTCRDIETEQAGSSLTINLVDVKYKSGKVVSFEEDTILDTGTNNIGDFYVTYTVTDDGIKLGDTVLEGSQSTVTYTKKCRIIYNDLPSMSLDSYVYTYSGDNTLTKDTIESFIKSYAKVSDKQDSIDNLPWWSKSNTNSALQNNLIVRGVHDIIVDSGYERGHENTTRQIKAITSLSDLYSLKDTNKEAFNAIRSFNVELDSQDQWGKYASGNLSKYAKDKGVVSNSEKDTAQSRSDRSILVIQTDDTTYNNAYEQIRFVSGAYLSSVGKNTYWGDSEYGKSKLENVLKLGSLVMKDGKLSNKVTITNKYVGSVNKVNNEHINIEVNYFKSK